MPVRPSFQEPPPRPDWLPSARPTPFARPEIPGSLAPSEPFSEPALELTEFLPVDTVGNIPPFPNPFRHPLRAIGWVVRFLFGIVSLVLMLAVVAAIPIVNFLALGYLLETEGRMARTGRLRFMFPLLDLAPRLGSIALGVWLWLLPVRLLSHASVDAMLLDPGGDAARRLAGLANFVAGAVAIHLCLALARGGALSTFFRPIKNLRWIWQRIQERDYWEQADRSIRHYVAGLRLRHHFWLGLRGFIGAAIWLWPPTLLFSALRQTEQPGQALVTLLGGALLLPVLAWVPFLQARMAAEDRFSAMFELRAVRELFRRAPIAWLISVVLTYALTLPLYLFKIVSPPQDILWGVTIVFIVSIYPARVFTGWAYHRAWRRTDRAGFAFRWLSRFLMLPLLAGYLFLLFFTPFIGEHGRAVLFEHHAFLLPSPF